MSDRCSIINTLVHMNGGVGSLSTEALNIYNVIKATLNCDEKTYGEYEFAQLLKFCSDLYNYWKGALSDTGRLHYEDAISWITNHYEMITDESENATEEPSCYSNSCQGYFKLIKKISVMCFADRLKAFGDSDFQKLLTTRDFYTLSDKLKKWEDKQNAIELYEKVRIKYTGEFGWVTKIDNDLYTVLTVNGGCEETQKRNLVKTGYFNMVLKDMFKEIAEENRPNE